ncbi:hypothetical protein AM1_E0012 (plasmid) [Acaryochloris marina MBIC11017]|uniref:Uncharacterized protein n=1 Tax=Acaryochloris marina (strain MBIC 11017) TaxID=329726 RepID=A8ZP46_ACAM1|nr:hypothetical protein AM1_E0012 [Acaryochloris marina MBIC11017]
MVIQLAVYMVNIISVQLASEDGQWQISETYLQLMSQH